MTTTAVTARMTPAARSPASLTEPAQAAGPRPMLAGYASLLAVGFVLLCFLDLPWYVNAALLPALQPKLFYFAMVAAALPLLAARSGAALRYLTSPFAIWALALIGLDIVHLLATLEPDAVPFIVNRIEVLVLMIVVGFVLTQAPRETIGRALFATAMLLAVLVLIDFLAPGRLLPQAAGPVGPSNAIAGIGEVAGRAAATLGNPNKAGEAMVMLALLALPFGARRGASILVALLAAAVAVTASRSSIAAMALVLAGGFALRALPRLMVAVMLALALLIAMNPEIVSHYLLGRADLGFGNIDNLLERFGSMLGANLSDASSTERFMVLSEGWRLFLENPLAGAGAGATDIWNLPVSVHNQAVLMLAEYGLFGAVLWLGALALPLAGHWWRESRALPLLASATVLLCSMATHNMFDFNYWLAALALMGAPRERISASDAAGAHRSADVRQAPPDDGCH